MTSEARRHVRPRRQKQHRHDGEQMGTLIPGAFPSRIDQCRMAQATAPSSTLPSRTLVRRHVRSWGELT